MSRNDPPDAAWIEAETARLVASGKYKDLPHETIADILRREVRPPASRKAVLASARERLHKVAAFYLGLPKFPRSAAALQAAFAAGDQAAIEAACLVVLQSHSSTRERLPHLAAIFEQLLARTGPIKRLVDIACAVQPLAWRWTGLTRDTEYVAVDINQRFLELIDLYLTLEQTPHQVLRQDAVVRPLTVPADVALLWKMYHCLEQRCAGAGLQVVEQMPARFLAISFPLHSLAGKKMGFHEKHGPVLQDAADRNGWKLQNFRVPGELFYLIEKPAP